MKNVRRSQEPRWDYMPRGDFSYQWTSLADGDLDWRRFLPARRHDGFRGPLVYEYVNPFKGMPPTYWEFVARTRRGGDAKPHLRGISAEIS